MKFIPGSLLARTALVIIVALVATQIVSVLLFRHYFNLPRQNGAAVGFISHLKTISAALETIPHERHPEFIARLHEKEGIRILPVGVVEPVTPAPDIPALQSVRSRLKDQFGDRADLFVGENSPNVFWVKLPIGENAFWIVSPRSRVERDTSTAWIGWAIFGTLVALIGAYFLVRRINRPLHELSLAAHEIGQGKTPAAVDESGPDEIRAVAVAFNQMGQDLARQERARATFLAGVSHDLRSPLARLRLNVEMLASSSDDETCTSMAHDIEDMDGIIGQFLDFARGESDETAVATDLNELIRIAVEKQSRAGAQIRVELATLPPARVRPIAIQRLLSNLLDNALKHGSGGIVVRTACQENYAVISVLDHGPGIPESEVERLKQPFTRLDAARTGKSGAGLGLAIVDRVVRLHNGKFDLLQRIGGGLEARALLPL